MTLHRCPGCSCEYPEVICSACKKEIPRHPLGNLMGELTINLSGGYHSFIDFLCPMEAVICRSCAEEFIANNEWLKSFIHERQNHAGFLMLGE